MTTRFKLILVIFVALLFSFGLTQCNSSSAPEEISYNENYDTISEVELQKTLATITIGELNDEEIEGLLFMREEEKLARDVYTTLYESYPLRVFNNISKSEQFHMKAVKYLLDLYELDDPAEGNGVGVFTNPELQTLYNNLIAMGQVSEIEALKVGVLIEDTDIRDLQTNINEIVENDDIKFVYTNLLRGSTNHLKAFTFNLKMRGVEYDTP